MIVFSKLIALLSNEIQQGNSVACAEAYLQIQSVVLYRDQAHQLTYYDIDI